MNGVITELLDPNIYFSRMSFLESSKQAIDIKNSLSIGKAVGFQKYKLPSIIDSYYTRSTLVKNFFDDSTEGRIRAKFSDNLDTFKSNLKEKQNRMRKHQLMKKQIGEKVAQQFQNYTDRYRFTHSTDNLQGPTTDRYRLNNVQAGGTSSHHLPLANGKGVYNIQSNSAARVNMGIEQNSFNEIESILQQKSVFAKQLHSTRDQSLDMKLPTQKSYGVGTTIDEGGSSRAYGQNVQQPHTLRENRVPYNPQPFDAYFNLSKDSLGQSESQIYTDKAYNTNAKDKFKKLNFTQLDSSIDQMIQSKYATNSSEDQTTYYPTSKKKEKQQHDYSTDKTVSTKGEYELINRSLGDVAKKYLQTSRLNQGNQFRNVPSNEYNNMSNAALMSSNVEDSTHDHTNNALSDGKVSIKHQPGAQRPHDGHPSSTKNGEQNMPTQYIKLHKLNYNLVPLNARPPMRPNAT